MTDKQFYSIFTDAISDDGASREAFVSDWALRSIWDDDDTRDIPDERITEIGDIWDVAHLTICDIRQYADLSQAKICNSPFASPADLLRIGSPAQDVAQTICVCCLHRLLVCTISLLSDTNAE